MKQGTEVEFKIGNVEGTGVVCGVATIPQAVIGKGLILEIVRIKTTAGPLDYPYTHMVAFENQVTVK